MDEYILRRFITIREFSRSKKKKFVKFHTYTWKKNRKKWKMKN